MEILYVSPLLVKKNLYMHAGSVDVSVLMTAFHFSRHGENMIPIAADTLNPMNWRYNSIGHTASYTVAIIDPWLNTIISSPKGFLSDLLKKANRHYDDKKLNEYTQTIVSTRLHKQFTRIHKRLLICASFLQLKMFDLNGDGKLGLSEMARWESFE